MRLDTKIKLFRIAIFVASIILVKVGLSAVSTDGGLLTPLGDLGGADPE